LVSYLFVICLSSMPRKSTSRFLLCKYNKWSRSRGIARSTSHLFGDKRHLPDVRLGQLLLMETRFESGEGGDAEHPEEVSHVGALCQRLHGRDVLLDEAAVDARLLDVLQRDRARGGSAGTGEVEVDAGGGGHDARRRDVRGTDGEERAAQTGPLTKGEGDARRTVAVIIFAVP